MPFIVFEGGEGVGKSTQIAKLAERLKSNGCEVVCTREPGGTPFAEKLRNIFKQTAAEGEDEPTPWAELLVVAAARAQHLEKFIRPALERNSWVLSDRFLDSAYVYQGLRAKLGPETVLQVHEHFMRATDCPDLTIVLDLDVAIAKNRLHDRLRPAALQTADRLDHADQAVFAELRSGFLGLAQKKMPYPFQKNVRRAVLDASGSTEQVAQEIWQVLSGVFGKVQ